MIEQTEAVGNDEVDHTKLPYPGYDLPHTDALERALLTHPHECPIPVDIGTDVTGETR